MTIETNSLTCHALAAHSHITSHFLSNTFYHYWYCFSRYLNALNESAKKTPDLLGDVFHENILSLIVEVQGFHYEIEC